MHGAILHRNNHKDSNLTFEDLWKFDADLIARDSISFFLVGRLWEQPQGVDHLAWIGMMVLSNVYWESQHYIPFLRHSFTLYEMHCVWPWPLWIFVAVIVTFLAMLMVCHVVQAYQTQVLRRKIVELVICLGLFLAPVVSSPYFHFHHWYAGWLLGMHSNFPNLWWSRAIMAWCWGTYVNGIAVYGRDPVLTCELAYFLSADQRCPFLLEENSNTDECQRTEILSTIFLWQHTFGGIFWNDDDDDDNITTTAGGMDPAVDWRNCSAHGYHP